VLTTPGSLSSFSIPGAEADLKPSTSSDLIFIDTTRMCIEATPCFHIIAGDGRVALFA
jgi:hypothetical protein